MNISRQLLVILVGATFGAGAFAQEATSDSWMKVGSSVSRAPVERIAGTSGSQEVHDFLKQGSTTKSREQVRAELAAAKASGEYETLSAEVSGFHLPRTQLIAAKTGR